MNERPNDVEAEQAVLGSLIIDPSAIVSVATTLKPDDFFTVHHAWIYEALIALGASADLMTISHWMADRKMLDESGGEAYLAQLTDTVPTALNVECYAEIVKRRAVSRKLLDSLSSIAIDCQNPALATEDLVARTQATIVKSLSDVTIKQAVSLDDAVDNFYADFDETLRTGIVPGIPTGIHEFDSMVGGWKPTRLTVVGALPGNGKTTLMLNTLLFAAKAGHRSAFFSLEMPEKDLIESLVSNDAGVDVSPVTLLKLSKTDQEEQRARIAHSLQRIRQLPIHLIYAPSASPEDMVYECKRLATRFGHIEFVAFDYIQLGRPTAVSKQANREQEVSAVALGLKRAAGELNCHIITGSQVNEQGDTRESKAITQHADTVIYLKRGDGAAPCNMMALTAEFWKNRKGKTGEIPLMFNKPLQRMAAMEVRKIQL